MNRLRTHRIHLWLMVAALYLAQGIPIGLAMEALPALLRRQGASLESLALLPLVGLPWVLKFLWATQVDDRWSPRIGRRRSWLLPMQALVLVCLVATAMLGVSAQTATAIIALAALASLASATQDIATDGLGAERFSGASLARVNALQVGGTMVGFFVGGAGCLVLTGLVGQRAALLVPAAIVAAGLLLAWCWHETSGNGIDTATDAQPVRADVACRGAATRATRASLRVFIRRPGTLLLLVTTLLSAMAAVSGYSLSKLILIDAGWAVDQVGRVAMGGGAITILLGCGGGAWLVTRFGARPVLIAGLVASALAAAGWAWLAQRGAASPAAPVWVATALGCFGTGAASVAIMTIAMAFARRAGQAGTDMTAVQSARDFGEIATSASLTALAAQVGYSGSFVAGVSLAALALVCAAALPAAQHGRR